jgi:hypothetical protein
VFHLADRYEFEELSEDEKKHRSIERSAERLRSCHESQ